MTIIHRDEKKIVIEGPDVYAGVLVRRHEVATILFAPNTQKDIRFPDKITRMNKKKFLENYNKDENIE